MNRVKELCKLKNIEQKQLIIDTGIGQSTISEYFTQKRDPKYDKLTKLAEYFDVDPLVINCYAPIPSNLLPVDMTPEQSSDTALRTEYDPNPPQRTSALTDDDLKKIASLVNTNPDAPRTPEARIVSFGMDNVPQEIRDKLLNIVLAVVAGTPEEKYFKENINDR